MLVSSRAAEELTPQWRVSTGEDVAQVILRLGPDAGTSVTGEVIREGTSAARTPLVALAPTAASTR